MIADPEPPKGPKGRGKRRKVTIQDAEEICRKIVRYRMNETDAAKTLGIAQRQWFLWKERKKHCAEFESLLLRIRESNIQACLDTIDAAGNPVTFETPKGSYKKPGDWRAKAWIAERVLAPERFGQQQAPATVTNSVTVQVLGGDDGLRRQIAMWAAEATKMLPAGPPTAPVLPAAAQDAAQDV